MIEKLKDFLAWYGMLNMLLLLAPIWLPSLFVMNLTSDRVGLIVSFVLTAAAVSGIAILITCENEKR